MAKFVASFIRGASIINPDTIEVDDTNVVYKKRRIYLVGYDQITIPIAKVSSIEIDSAIIGTDITITSLGEGIIHAHRFSIWDAKEIKRLIEALL